MKKINICGIGLFVIMATVFIIAGCSSGSGVPSTADVKGAFAAITTGVDAVPAADSAVPPVPPYTYSGSFAGGSISVSYSSSSDPNAGPWTIAGTLTFTNWHDASSGYTISGTVSVSVSSNVKLNDLVNFPQIETVHMICNLVLSGGTVSTLGCDVTSTMTTYSGPPYMTASGSGTITANGYVFDITKLQ